MINKEEIFIRSAASNQEFKILPPCEMSLTAHGRLLKDTYNSSSAVKHVPLAYALQNPNKALVS